MGNITEGFNAAEKFMDTVFNDSFEYTPNTPENIDGDEISQQVNFLFQEIKRTLTGIKK